MVSAESVEKQLKKLKFNIHSWGRSEAKELPNILMEDEIIFEVVNGMYDGGFAMLVATNIRVLLVDKKPLNFLTVEDFRFDMITEIDYNHRLIGAHISLSSGVKTLKFTSYNQQRLRKLIGHVQHCIADGKKQDDRHQVDQKQHLEQINQQLQAYLLAQHQQQQQFQEQMAQQTQVVANAAQKVLSPEPIKPSPELNDYLFAQSLLADYKAQQADGGRERDIIEATTVEVPKQIEAAPELEKLPPVAQASVPQANSEMAELYAEGMQEIYGKRQQRLDEQAAVLIPDEPVKVTQPTHQQLTHLLTSPLEINPLKIAYSKLPMALRNRKFGRPSFHSHSQAEVPTTQPITEV